MPPRPALDADDDVLQAVVLADSFNSRFKPLTASRPRCLIPICNAPLLEWTFESLVLAGVREIFVVCRSYPDLIKKAIQQSRYSHPRSGVKIATIITSKETFAPGDALRDIYTHGVITSDFVLVSGDLVSSVKIDQVVALHKERRKKNKDIIMTVVVKESGGKHRTRPKGDTGLFVLDPSTSECLHYEPVPGQPNKTHASIPRELLQEHPEIEIRNDLIDCAIDVCAVEVPSLFQDNFDYQDVRRDFVHGILTSDLLKRNIYCHIVKDDYAARVRDTKSYGAITNDILSRWTFPLVPDGNYPGRTKYEHRRGNNYLPSDMSVILARTTRLGNNVMLGPRTHLNERVVVSGSVLGEGVTVGEGTSISNSHVFRDCRIGANCMIDWSILGDGVIIQDGCRIKEGCILEDGVAIGPGVTLESFSRASLARFRSDDDDSEGEEGDHERAGHIGQANLGSKSKGFLWPPFSSREDGGNELENFENLQHLRIGADQVALDTVDPGSDSEDEDEEPGTKRRTRRMSNASATSSIGGGGADAEFRHECVQSLERAFAKNISVDNTAIELKTTIRMTYNMPLRRVSELAIGFLVDQIPLGVEVARQREAIRQLIHRWGPLIPSIGGTTGAETVGILQVHCAKEKPGLVPLFGNILALLYNEDIVDEDDIREWHGSKQSRGVGIRDAEVLGEMERCRRVGTMMIERFEEEEDSE